MEQHPPLRQVLEREIFHKISGLQLLAFAKSGHLRYHNKKVIELGDKAFHQSLALAFDALNDRADQAAKQLLQDLEKPRKAKRKPIKQQREHLNIKLNELKTLLQHRIDTERQVADTLMKQDLYLNHYTDTLLSNCNLDEQSTDLSESLQLTLNHFQTELNNIKIPTKMGHSPSWLERGAVEHPLENRDWRYCSEAESIDQVIKAEMQRVSKTLQGLSHKERVKWLTQKIADHQSLLEKVEQLKTDYLTQAKEITYQEMQDRFLSAFTQRLLTEHLLIETLDSIRHLLNSYPVAKTSPELEWIESIQTDLDTRKQIKQPIEQHTPWVTWNTLALQALAKLPEGDISEEYDVQLETLSDWTAQHQADQAWLADQLHQLHTFISGSYS